MIPQPDKLLLVVRPFLLDGEDPHVSLLQMMLLLS
jgi:hypothetical protein